VNYRKVTVEIVVQDDDCEGVIQQVSDDLERLQNSIVVFRSEIRDEKTGKPENAAEIAAPIP
jgi:hypothetical protein